MHFTSFAIAALASVALAQTPTGALSSAPTCAAQNILDACIGIIQGQINSCATTDYGCLCTAYYNLLTCYNNCPQDTGVTTVQQEREQYCIAASAYPSSTSAAVKATASTSVAATTTASLSGSTTATSSSSSAQATATKNAAAGIQVAGGLIGAVAVGFVRQYSSSLQGRSRAQADQEIISHSARKSPALNIGPNKPTPKSSGQRRYASSRRKPEQNSSDTSKPITGLVSLQRDISKLESALIPPTAQEVLEVLKKCHDFAVVTLTGSTQPTGESQNLRQQTQDPATSALHALDSLSSNSAPSSQPSTSQTLRQKTINTICELMYDLARNPKIFITPSILANYTKTQILLGRPEYLPEIFYLYANKPIPKPNTSPIQYTNSWPNTPKNAIPLTISDAALDAAIAKKDLPLALAIIDTTVATQAFKRNKLIAKGSLPFLAWCSIPATAYTGAQYLSEYQQMWDPSMMKWMTMAGSMAYVGTLTIIGFVAFSTWNDHHERVRWQPGIRLRDRWIKEEERLYFDRIALAWGFQSKVKRGEEQGEEWDALKENVMVRGMVLDQSDLIEGMNP